MTLEDRHKEIVMRQSVYHSCLNCSVMWVAQELIKMTTNHGLSRLLLNCVPVVLLDGRMNFT